MPGFISITKKTIDDFYNELNNNGLNLKGFFFNALNGGKYLKIFNPPITALDYLNTKFGNFKCKNKMLEDHSKILALIEFTNDLISDDITHELKNGNFIVRGILIGSSNQSANTYCYSPSPKGEADVFLVEYDNPNLNFEKNFIDNLLEYNDNQNLLNKNIIVTKEIKRNNCINDLKSIVTEIIKQTL